MIQWSSNYALQSSKTWCSRSVLEPFWSQHIILLLALKKRGWGGHSAAAPLWPFQPRTEYTFSWHAKILWPAMAVENYFFCWRGLFGVINFLGGYKWHVFSQSHKIGTSCHKLPNTSNNGLLSTAPSGVCPTFFWCRKRSWCKSLGSQLRSSHDFHDMPELVWIDIASTIFCT